jgi:hypothetical protein
MKTNLCVAIDEPVSLALDRFCKRVIKNIAYKRSKSEVVNEALIEYLTGHEMLI